MIITFWDGKCDHDERGFTLSGEAPNLALADYLRKSQVPSSGILPGGRQAVYLEIPEGIAQALIGLGISWQPGHIQGIPGCDPAYLFNIQC